MRVTMNKISTILTSWYQENKRELPWRETKNPYYIWVSEIMLQQTRVEAVISYYQRFITTLPSINDLANCEDDIVMKLWEGLGYYSRVRNMKKAAIICRDQYNGSLPTTYQELIMLPGIGDYTAGAIASIAFNERICAIDGNVLRIYARLFLIEKNILQEKTKKEIKSIMSEDLSESMSDMNQALMDIGATICLGNGKPKCQICPLSSQCEAFKANRVEELPIRIKNTIKKKEKLTIVIHQYKNQVLLHKRQEKGLLAGLYEFETLEGHYSKHDYPISKYLGNYQHIFSHKIWDMKGFLLPSKERFEKEDYIWVDINDLEDIYSIPTAFHFFKKKIENNLL